ncbi:hypothetical protein Tsubulata_025407 [Turnera subulata]|uniref:Cytochrome P450 n=1 Tax=Turnera subulata TaxID=218843 RepID=A0A9Q0JID9_9ROSI|nr:hypothetical protein Tsubulata_025407 [Turnera subulata]
MELHTHLEQPSSESLPILVLATLVAVLAGYHYYYKHKASKLSGKRLPPGSVGLPLVGETISFLRAQKQDKVNQWMQKRFEEHGQMFKTSIFGAKTVVLTGQAGNRFLFNAGDNGVSFQQPKSLVSVLGKYSLFELSGSRHKLFRNAIVGFVKPESLQRFVGLMDSLVQQQLAKQLDGKDSVQIVTLMKKMAFNVTCSILFGIPDGEEKEIFLEEFSTAVKGCWSIPVEFPGTVFHTAMKARKSLCKRLLKLIDKVKAEMEAGRMDAQDNMIATFVALRDENGEPVTEEEMLDMVLSLVMASHDTTTILLTLFIRYLSRDSELYNKVLQEQKEFLKVRQSNGGRLNWTDMQRMKYTWRVAQEILRFYPPIFGNFRQIVRDDVNFDGFDIPKGWQLLWVASGTHMDSNIFEDPEKFDPSRFETSSKTYPQYTYLPFGAGPRMCPGNEFARIESLLVIHHFITKYKWTEMVPDEPIIRAPLPFPAKGLPVKLYAVNNEEEL